VLGVLGRRACANATRKHRKSHRSCGEIDTEQTLSLSQNQLYDCQIDFAAEVSVPVDEDPGDGIVGDPYGLSLVDFFGVGDGGVFLDSGFYGTDYPTFTADAFTVILAEYDLAMYLGAPLVESVNSNPTPVAGQSTQTWTVDLIGQFLMLYYTDVDTGQQTPYPSTVVLNDGNGQPVQAQPTITAQTDTDMTLSVPAALTAGSYSLVVTTSIGWTTSTNFTVGDPTPSISCVSPSTWMAGQTTPVTVVGSGFGTSPLVSVNDGNVSLTAPALCPGSVPPDCQPPSSYATLDQCFTTSATVPPTDPGGPSYTLTVTSQGYGGSGFFSGGTGNPPQNPTGYPINIINISTGLAPATASSVDTNLISPPTMDLSTGDTATQVVVTTTPSNFTFTPVFTFIDSGNPTSSDCNATLSFSQNSGSGSVYSTVTASPAGCSGVFNGSAAAFAGSTPSKELRIVVPPQIMIQTEVGEAGLQTAPGDASMPALLLVAENRFGDGDFRGGATGTWQSVLGSGDFYGATNTTANGVQPELTYAAEVFAGASQVSIPSGCEAYWSPTNDQYTTLKAWASQQAQAISDNGGPSPSWSDVGAPDLPAWYNHPKQAVIVSSILNNARQDGPPYYNQAPAFVLFQLAPSPTAPSVTTY